MHQILRNYKRKLMIKRGAEVKYQPAEETSAWVTFFTSIIPFVIIFILFFFLLNQAQAAVAVL